MAEVKELKPNKINICKGYLFPPLLTEEWLEQASTSFVPRDSDIFVGSYPKSGTHWLAHIVLLLKHKEKLSKSFFPFHATFLEIPQKDELPPLAPELLKGDLPAMSVAQKFRITKSQIEGFPDPRMFFTHFPFEYLPQNPKTKYFYIYRNVKDAVLSMYNHLSNNIMSSFQGTFNEFFDFFIERNCFNYFKHIKGYIEHKDDPNYFILSYEDLQANFKVKVGEIAKFLECELTEELYELILKETSFESMRENHFINGKEAMKEGKYLFIKGKVGTWKDSLSQEQSKELDRMLLSELGEEFISKYIKFE